MMSLCVCLHFLSLPVWWNKMNIMSCFYVCSPAGTKFSYRVRWFTLRPAHAADTSQRVDVSMESSRDVMMSAGMRSRRDAGGEGGGQLDAMGRRTCRHIAGRCHWSAWGFRYAATRQSANRALIVQTWGSNLIFQCHNNHITDYSSLCDDALQKCHVYKVFNVIIFNHEIDVFLHVIRLAISISHNGRTDSAEIRRRFSSFF